MRVLVLGGNGFIGSNIVTALRAKHFKIRIGSRFASASPEVVQIRFETMQTKADWLPVLDNIDAVINTVGILRERRNESYAKIHTIAPTALAQACAELGLKLVHISALGLNAQAKSRFITSKYWGEIGILSSNAPAVIVQPSLLDGEGGFGAKWFRRVATWPVQAVMQTQGLVAPLQVSDLGEAVANLIKRDFTNMPKIMALGGEQILSIADYLNVLRTSMGKNAAWQIAVPKILVRALSHLCDLLALTPLSYGHYELMQGQNVPKQNWLPILLGRTPNALGLNQERLSLKMLEATL